MAELYCMAQRTSEGTLFRYIENRYWLSPRDAESLETVLWAFGHVSQFERITPQDALRICEESHWKLERVKKMLGKVIADGFGNVKTGYFPE